MLPHCLCCVLFPYQPICLHYAKVIFSIKYRIYTKPNSSLVNFRGKNKNKRHSQLPIIHSYLSAYEQNITPEKNKTNIFQLFIHHSLSDSLQATS